MLLHRVLAIMFIDKPEDHQEVVYIVNHRDGVKHNFELTNLEWVTYSRNSIHALETGLRNDNTPVLVKDLRTGNIQRFYSLQDCARHFKVNGFSIYWNLLPRNRNKVSYNYFLLILEGEEWPDIDLSSIGKHRNGRPKPIMAINVDNGLVVVYDSLGSLARTLGLKVPTLCQRLIRNENLIIDDLLIKYLDEPETAKNYEMVSVGRKTRPPTRQPVPVIVRNILTGEELSYKSTEEFALNLGASKTAVQVGMHVNGGRWRNYFITYVRPPGE